jgi:hypothetical protein
LWRERIPFAYGKILITHWILECIEVEKKRRIDRFKEVFQKPRNGPVPIPADTGVNRDQERIKQPKVTTVEELFFE